MKENEADRQVELSREATLEAVLFAAGNPLPLASLAAIMDCEEPDVVELARDLQAKLTSEGSGLTVQRVAGGYQLVTRPEAYATVERLSQVTDRHLSAPTMETLSIIAFKQPITKPEIEQLRGVRVERALAKLLELDLICELGRKQVIGRPILYGTTATFLRCFGLDSLDDLPQLPDIPEQAGLLETSGLPEQAADPASAEPSPGGGSAPDKADNTNSID